ncbi:unnamed protein product [Heterosigma akashiwo]
MTFLFINVVAIAAALSVATGQVMSVISDGLTIQEMILRGYCFVFCLGIVLFEMEWTKPIRDMILCHNWVLRGVMYVFVGLLGLEEETEEVAVSDAKSSDEASETPERNVVATAVVELTAYIIIGVGLLYILMGVFCLKRLRDERLSKHRKLMAWAEVEESRLRGADDNISI